MNALLQLTYGTAALLGNGVVLAQNGNMMDGGAWGMGWMGGYGGIWLPVLLVIAVVGAVAWSLKKKGK